LKAREDHVDWQDWGILLGILVFTVSPWLLRYISAHNIATFASRNAWHISLIGLAALLVRMFWHSFLRYDDLAEKQKPKLDIRCSPNLPGCVPMNQSRDFANRFFRVEIESICDVDIHDCEATLIRIEKDGVTIWGPNTAMLTFAPWNPPDDFEPKKTIHNRTTVYLDIFYITNDGEIVMATRDREWRFMPGLHQLFASFGNYLLTVQIMGEPLKTETIFLNFEWTGDWMTSGVTRVMQPSPIPDRAISPP
jgi:hypothetical protein